MFVLKSVIVFCTYFYCYARFWILKYEQCWRVVSVIPLKWKILNGFTDSISDALKCFLTKMLRKFVESFPWYCFAISTFKNANSYHMQLNSINSGTFWRKPKSASPEMKCFSMESNRNLKVLPIFFYFSLHAESGIRLNGVQVCI